MPSCDFRTSLSTNREARESAAAAASATVLQTAVSQVLRNTMRSLSCEIPSFTSLSEIFGQRFIYKRRFIRQSDLARSMPQTQPGRMSLRSNNKQRICVTR